MLLSRVVLGLILVVGLNGIATCVQADEITYRSRSGQMKTAVGTLLDAPEEISIIENSNGRIDIIPARAITEHIRSGVPAPITPAEMVADIEEQFGKDLVRTEINKNTVTAMILAAPLPKRSEGAVRTFAKKGGRFMVNVNNVFLKYAEQMDFPLTEPKFPFVLLIFESDADFNHYYGLISASQGAALSADGVLGFYSSLTNWLAVRMSSCDSFAVPLHEAVHQQMANRVHQRLAPIPRWFSEGIANSFEGSGEKISSNPRLLNPDYVRLSQRTQNQNWSEILGSDDSFFDDVLAGNAYTISWCLHWTASTQHKAGYQEYVKELSKRANLQKINPDEEQVLFERAFGMTLDEVQKSYLPAALNAARKAKIDLSVEPQKPVNQMASCRHQIEATVSQSGMVVNGSVMNINPFRDQTVYLTVETNGGEYFQYLLPDLKSGAEIRLAPNQAALSIPGAPKSRSTTYKTYVRAVPADSDEAAKWKQGQVPGPFTAKAYQLKSSN